MNNRFKILPNGAVYDTKDKRIVKNGEAPIRVETPKEEPKAPTEMPTETPKSPKSRKKNIDADISIAKAHTTIAREILTYNSSHELHKTDAAWLQDRGFWYFDRCIEIGVTPTPQGLTLALGFKASEENMLISGNDGLPTDCKEVVSAFKQALEMVAEGTLVDSKSGVVGRIFDLKNRFGWSDQGNAVTEQEPGLAIKSPEELRKALAKMPGLDLIDSPKEVVIDADYEVIE